MVVVQEPYELAVRAISFVAKPLSNSMCATIRDHAFFNAPIWAFVRKLDARSLTKIIRTHCLKLFGAHN